MEVWELTVSVGVDNGSLELTAEVRELAVKDNAKLFTCIVLGPN